MSFELLALLPVVLLVIQVILVIIRSVRAGELPKIEDSGEGDLLSRLEASAQELGLQSQLEGRALSIYGQGWELVVRARAGEDGQGGIALLASVVATVYESRAWPEGLSARGQGTLRFDSGARQIAVESDEELLFAMIGCSEAIAALNWSGQNVQLELRAPGALQLTAERTGQAAEQLVRDWARACDLIVAANASPRPWGEALPVEIEVAESVYRAAWAGSPVRLGVAKKLVSWGEGDRLFADALAQALGPPIEGATAFGSLSTEAQLVALTFAFDPGWQRVLARDPVVLDALDAHDLSPLAWTHRLLCGLSAHARGDGLTWRSPRALIIPSARSSADMQALAGLLHRVALEVLDWAWWPELEPEVAPALALTLILIHAQHPAGRSEATCARLVALVEHSRLKRAEVLRAVQHLVIEADVVAALCQVPGHWHREDAQALTAILWRPDWAGEGADQCAGAALEHAQGEAFDELLEWVVERGGVACMRVITARREAQDSRALKAAQQQLAARLEAAPGRAASGALSVAQGQGGELSLTRDGDVSLVD